MGSSMDTWLDSLDTYDIYDTNDGVSMTIMTQVRYKGWNMTYMTYQVKIEHPIEISCYAMWPLSSPSIFYQIE